MELEIYALKSKIKIYTDCRIIDQGAYYCLFIYRIEGCPNKCKLKTRKEVLQTNAWNAYPRWLYGSCRGWSLTTTSTGALTISRTSIHYVHIDAIPWTSWLVMKQDSVHILTLEGQPYCRTISKGTQPIERRKIVCVRATKICMIWISWLNREQSARYWATRARTVPPAIRIYFGFLISKVVWNKMWQSWLKQLENEGIGGSPFFFIRTLVWYFCYDFDADSNGLQPPF